MAWVKLLMASFNRASISRVLGYVPIVMTSWYSTSCNKTVGEHTLSTFNCQTGYGFI